MLGQGETALSPIAEPNVRRTKKAAMVATSSGMRNGIAENPTGTTTTTMLSANKPIEVLKAEIPPAIGEAIGVPTKRTEGKCYSIRTMSCRVRVAGIGLDSRTCNFFRIDPSPRTGWSE